MSSERRKLLASFMGPFGMVSQLPNPQETFQKDTNTANCGEVASELEL